MQKVRATTSQKAKPKIYKNGQYQNYLKQAGRKCVVTLEGTAKYLGPNRKGLSSNMTYYLCVDNSKNPVLCSVMGYDYLMVYRDMVHLGKEWAWTDG